MKKVIFKNFLYESISSKVLIVVDIQPEYEDSFSFKAFEWGNWINKNVDNYDSVYFLYNGPTLGFPSEGEYIMWLLEYAGIKEEIIENINFFDKGYNFFRYCMDEGIDEGEIIQLVRYMYNNNLSDTREISEDDWNNFKQEYPNNSIDELLKDSTDMMFIPDLMDYLNDNVHSNIDIMGGGSNECLREVEIALEALRKPFNRIDEYTY